MKYRVKRNLVTVAIIASLLLVIASVNIISAFHFARLDFTADHRHTLSRGTRNILSQIQTPVTITFYFSQSAKQVPQPIKDYARRVSDLLREFEGVGNGKIIVKQVDAKQESQIEDAANLVGIERQPLAGRQAYFYMGIEVACIDRTVTLPCMQTQHERTLEYSITRSIQRVIRSSRKRVGVLSVLPVMGAGSGNPFVFRGSIRPWRIVTELRKDYEVSTVDPSKDLPDGLDVLVLIHPQKLNPALLFQIDQFLLRGGRIVAFIDPLSSVQVNSRGVAMKDPAADANSSTLDPLLRTWGIDYAMDKVVADPGNSIAREQRRQPAFLKLGPGAMGKEDVISSSLTSLVMPYAGKLTWVETPGLQKTTLLRSSPSARLVDVKDIMEKRPLDPIINKRKPQQFDLAIKLNGRFVTAYPGGPPTKNVALGHKPLKRGDATSTVIVVADVDMLEDRMWTHRSFDRHTQKETVEVQNDNNTFLQNAVEQLAGGDDLIAIRSRTDLPGFTRVDKLWQQADERLRDELVKWQREEKDTLKKITALYSRRNPNQRYIESPEEHRERERLSKRRKEIVDNIKRLNRERRKEIDQLGSRVLWINVLTMPILVALAGIAVAIYRRLN